MIDLFKELLPNIMEGTSFVLENEKEYNSWLVNKALTIHMDTILYANEMNINYGLDKRLQYDYLFHAIRKRKRPFQKWMKNEKSDEILAISEYFGMSKQKAKETINILTKQQIKEIMGIVKSKDSGFKK